MWHYHLHVTPRYFSDGFYLTEREWMPVGERALHAWRLKGTLAQMPPGGRTHGGTGQRDATMTLERIEYFWGLFEVPSTASFRTAGKVLRLEGLPFPDQVRTSFEEERIADLSGDYGAPKMGAPTEIDHLEFTVDGSRVTIRVANRGISMFTVSTPELVRLHRFFSVLHTLAS